ncbi:ABC transporter permease [Desulfosarcina ovata]|nr:FtsX-like permease family protein [Desulfosarcina ovata]BBO86602.1 hypothetical protein DSCO28_71680 [Desulfosarcina ovata subsp. sediminis]
MEKSTDSGAIRIDRQVVLPFDKSLSIAFQSIRVRFFRSLITTLNLVLAVAFLCFVSLTTDIANGLLASGEPGLRQALINSGYDLSPEETHVGASPKQRWILILSLLVCVVGIVNAQLMAVTERFREIGTMKCLGALNRFILKLFLLEAAMQGLAGALVGALCGGLFALLHGLVRFNLPAMAWLPAGAVLRSVAVSVAIGCGLNLLGAFYPALVAARMQPVAAMRVDQ